MPTAPYDTFYAIMAAARVRLNDVINTLSPVSAQILKNSQDFSHAMVNSAWRKLQGRLADMKYSGLERELTFTSLPPTHNTDPLSQVFIDYTGYFDTVTLWPAFALPQTFIRPYLLWERVTGSAGNMLDMDDIRNGLPSDAKGAWNRQWEWRNDTLYMKGATGNTDIRIRYAGLIPDPGDNTPLPATPWYAQVAPIMYCLDSLADYICREAVIAVKDMDWAMAFQASAEANAQLILNRDTAQPSAIAKASEYYRMADKDTPMKGGSVPQAVKR